MASENHKWSECSSVSDCGSNVHQLRKRYGLMHVFYLVICLLKCIMYSDPSVCFSRFLGSGHFGGFTEPQYLTDLPSRDTISYELINPVDGSTTKLELYYLVITPPGHSTMALVQSNANQGLSCSTNRKRKSQPRPQYELDLSTAPALLTLSGVKPLYQVASSYFALPMDQFQLTI